MLNFKWYEFSELTAEQLYNVLMLRSDVFIVEQNCVYPDVDGKDFFALHLLGMQENSLVAYLRLFPPTEIENSIVFGRVATSPSARNRGYGHKMLQELMDYCTRNFPGLTIKCSAQNYLKEFYEKYGFKASGDVYDEDGIPHVAMCRRIS